MIHLIGECESHDDSTELTLKEFHGTSSPELIRLERGVIKYLAALGIRMNTDPSEKKDHYYQYFCKS